MTDPDVLFARIAVLVGLGYQVRVGRWVTGYQCVVSDGEKHYAYAAPMLSEALDKAWEFHGGVR